MSVRSSLIVLSLSLSTASWGCSFGIANSEILFGLMAERLAYMPAVAEYKYQRGLPIEDLQREQQVLASSLQSARELGLDEDRARQFIQAQINAAKQIQSRQRQAGAELSEIRAELIALGQRQLDVLACLQQQDWRASDSERPAFERALGNIALTDSERQALFSSLR
jgi:chorismate mutase